MKKATMKSISLALASLMAASSMAVTASAVYNPELRDEYEATKPFYISFRESESRADTIYVSHEDLEAGNNTFNVGVYLSTDTFTPDELTDITVNWNGYYEDGDICKYMTFPRVGGTNVDKRELVESLAVEGVDDVDAITANDDFDFGRYDDGCIGLNKRGHSGWDITAFAAHYNDVVSAGPNRIYLNNTGIGETVVEGYYDLVVDEKTGTATTVTPVSKPGSSPFYKSILRYDPTIPEGQAIGKSSYFGVNILNLSRSTIDTWNGGKSDANAVVRFDVKLAPETPDGVYYVGVNEGSYDLECFRNYVEFGVLSGNLIEPTNAWNDRDYWLKIVVGDGEADTAEETVSYDINGDGVVDMQDASEALNMYAQSACGSMLLQSSSTQDDYFKLAQEILSDCAMRAAGLI